MASTDTISNEQLSAVSPIVPATPAFDCMQQERALRHDQASVLLWRLHQGLQSVPWPWKTHQQGPLQENRSLFIWPLFPSCQRGREGNGACGCSQRTRDARFFQTSWKLGCSALPWSQICRQGTHWWRHPDEIYGERDIIVMKGAFEFNARRVKGSAMLNGHHKGKAWLLAKVSSSAISTCIFEIFFPSTNRVDRLSENFFHQFGIQQILNLSQKFTCSTLPVAPASGNSRKCVAR